jgi:glycosyltransferase involved in cell wall biosynthesis
MLQPLISVIVAEKNSARTIRQCLNSLLGLTYPRFEIIVVDDGSTDETGRILSEYSGKIRLIRLNSGQGPSSARNAAASQAKGDFIAFTDGDCVVDSS